MLGTRISFMYSAFPVGDSDCVFCPMCGKLEDIKTRRLNTNYTEELENWFTSCLDCYEGEVNYYAELWSDYYAGVL